MARADGPIPLGFWPFGLTGRNWLGAWSARPGPGKTTVLRTIAGLWQTRARRRVTVQGKVWLDSAQVLPWPAHRRRVGVVFSELTPCFPHKDRRTECGLCESTIWRAEHRRDEAVAPAGSGQFCKACPRANRRTCRVDNSNASQ